MGSFDRDRYEKAKAAADKYIKKNKKVKCPALGLVRLNSNTLKHLIFKGEHKRDWKNQLKRFELLKYSKKILEGMSHYQEYCECKQMIEIKDENNKRKKVKKDVTYWGFVAVINDKIRIKLVIRKIGNGSKLLWSVIPAWKQGYKEITILHTGNMESD
ncbi:hypothetical protein HOK22_04760 [Candidatus Peregrinibacteria bacterium]|nr:hypothetical protein [Candidatus Peregrinibacteria bacterium]